MISNTWHEWRLHNKLGYILIIFKKNYQCFCQHLLYDQAAQPQNMMFGQHKSWAEKYILILILFNLIFESAREARRLLAIMCIGFLANHRVCKHPQNQLVRICHFSNTFPLHLIHSSMLDISKQFWIIDKANKWGAIRVWIYLFIIRNAHGHACRLVPCRWIQARHAKSNACTDYFLKVYSQFQIWFWKDE